ncbi:hypothetical protein HYPDE_35038 [Hyphomicrobium denitrificans 1NES1]|uniref:Uncharacterized protein n=1 Tax=Hyphomicrobium denitrificans 1NES1 TaxID=670307 RepID=N0B577_9HYPH|nr:hypothetical protein HYPDE_35038 [Hyphomicrobium denitrificans 1NES1]
MNRRTFITSGVAGGLWALGGFGALGAAREMPIVLKPFAHSRTVTTFAQGLFDHWHFADETDFPPLRQMIEAEFIQTGTPNIYDWDYRPATGPAPQDSEADKIERRSAAFFARLAIEHIAPCALRRAGFEQMAADVASGVLAPAAAQHTIGAADAARCRAAGAPSPMPTLESSAYGASAHASTTAFYAGHQEIDVVAQTGYFCARALLDAFSYDDDIVIADTAWIWDFAAMVINAAIDLDSDTNALHVLALNTAV